MDSGKSYILLYLKGVAMGAADVVPGVSGGTIAFISGIYEELIDTLRGIRPGLIGVLKNQGIREFWKKINGNFLVVLLAGVLTSIVSLAHLITWLMAAFPEMLWSFFFGLVISSAVLIRRQMARFDIRAICAMTIGFLMAWNLNLIIPATVHDISLLRVFISGAVAICAMILPGISGAFILVILGMYEFIIDALRALNIPVILVFTAGCLGGLLSFSHLLSAMFHHCRNVTLALLTGFMLGSLNKVWPWKLTLEYRTDRHGQLVPLIQENVSPLNYEALTRQNPFLIQGIILMAAAFLLVIGLEKIKDLAESK